MAADLLFLHSARHETVICPPRVRACRASQVSARRVRHAHPWETRGVPPRPIPLSHLCLPWGCPPSGARQNGHTLEIRVEDPPFTRRTQQVCQEHRRRTAVPVGPPGRDSPAGARWTNERQQVRSPGIIRGPPPVWPGPGLDRVARTDASPLAGWAATWVKLGPVVAGRMAAIPPGIRLAPKGCCPRVRVLVTVIFPEWAFLASGRWTFQAVLAALPRRAVIQLVARSRARAPSGVAMFVNP